MLELMQIDAKHSSKVSITIDDNTERSPEQWQCQLSVFF